MRARQGPVAKERWGRGEAYEPFVGRWSRLAAPEFLRWLSPAPGGRWLDVGCGTGALTQAILVTARPAAVAGHDPSSGYLAYAASTTADEWVSFRVADALDIPADDASYDFVVSGPQLHPRPSPHRRGDEARGAPGRCGRGLRLGLPRGDEALAILLGRRGGPGPGARELDEGRRFTICRPHHLARLWHAAGLRDVGTLPIEVRTVFDDSDDYWTPFLGGQGPAPCYCVSLPDKQRRRLREALRARLPTARDGTIRLLARAWAVRGLA